MTTSIVSPFRVHAPGRVNLLGEHVDYNDGLVLPAAIDRSVSLDVHPLAEERLELHAVSFGQSATLNLAGLEHKVDAEGRPLPSWALYPAGVAWALQQHGMSTPGARVSLSSDIPMGSGLSSSAAVEVAFAVMWQALGGWEMDRMTLARLCQKAENVYVGLNCGLMDQFASAHGQEGRVLWMDTRNLEWGSLPLPAGISLVIANSGVKHSLTGSEYNERRQSCEEAVRLLQPHLPGIRALRDVSPADFERLGPALPEGVRCRAQYVVQEVDRSWQARRLLQEGDVRAFGGLMFQTHAGLRDLYQVSTPELDALVEIAGGLPGCLGARLTGAGFGGCTVNLVEEQNAAAFVEALRAAYRERSGIQAEVYLCRASEGAGIRLE